MNENVSIRPSRILRTATLIAGSVAIAGYLFVALSRLGYPFELEWMEGGAVDHVRRILAGQPLYVAPSLSFIPYIYTPLYFYVSAALAKVIGVGFLPLRLVSLASSLGCLALIGLIVRRETRSWRAALLAAGFFAATFRHSGRWFDLARVDSLFLFLVLGGVLAAGPRPRTRALALSGFLLGLSFLAKQAALPIMAAMTVYTVWSDRRRSLLFIACGWGLVIGSTLLLNRLHHGWYSYYVLDLPQQHRILPKMLLGFWIRDIAMSLPAAVILTIAWFSARRPRSRGSRAYYALLGAGMVGTAMIGRLHQGGYENVLMPADVFFAIMLGIAAHMLVTGRGESQENAPAPHAVPRGHADPGRESLVYAACILQFGLLAYNPAKDVPGKADADAGWQLIRMISAVDGEVLIPAHGYLPYLAGKETHAHLMAIHDVMRGSPGEIRDRLVEEILHALGGRRFEAVILDAVGFGEDPSDRGLQEIMERDYKRPLTLFREKDTNWTVTGFRTRPEMLFLLNGPGR